MTSRLTLVVVRKGHEDHLRVFVLFVVGGVVAPGDHEGPSDGTQTRRPLAGSVTTDTSTP